MNCECQNKILSIRNGICGNSLNVAEVSVLEIKFTAEEIVGMAVMMNNGTVPFMGLATILPQGVDNPFKWKPSFMFDKVVKESKSRFEQMGILESYEFTNLTYVMLKSKYQISIAVGDKLVESIFLAENDTAAKMKFEDDGTYSVTDGFDQKTLVEEFAKQAQDGSYKVFLKEHLCKPVTISADDIEEIFNLMHI